MIIKEKQMGCCFGGLFQARRRCELEEQDCSVRLSFDVYIRDDDTCFQETDNNASPSPQISPGLIYRSRSSNMPLAHNAKQYPRPSGCRLGRDSVKPSPPPRALSVSRDKKKIDFPALSQDMTSSNRRNTLGDFLQHDSGATAMNPHLCYLFTSEATWFISSYRRVESWRKRREQENHQQQEADTSGDIQGGRR